ncbi:HAD family hydrolase [Sphaerisporangium siamense]|uniref:HAD superfamily hydrolase (TIGR01509 family) n=1 Tax=Sphaerisporangium siamense TaxID=795645 RepID=A0A7W7D8X6_9ACTN|nr:HAD family phosphatase [Sphaerisporangium siamense]MBB4702417.1 HAD superfamily hydrolase (TIGR01509 family) [Sphaerisporangium siamense]
MPIPHDAVVFDCDGTLVDTETAWNDAYRDLFARYGVPLDPVARTRLVGLQLAELGEELAYLLGRPAPPEELGRAVYEMVCDGTTAPGTIVPMPGAVELVTALHGTRPLAIATNTPVEIVTGYLRRAGIHDAFDAVVDFAAAGAAKPSPLPYLRACAELGVHPGRAIAVEDSRNGTVAARAAGMFVVGVPSHPEIGLEADLVAAGLRDPRVWLTFGVPVALLDRPAPGAAGSSVP